MIHFLISWRLQTDANSETVSMIRNQAVPLRRHWKATNFHLSDMNYIRSYNWKIWEIP